MKKNALKLDHSLAILSVEAFLLLIVRMVVFGIKMGIVTSTTFFNKLNSHWMIKIPEEYACIKVYYYFVLFNIRNKINYEFSFIPKS